MFHAFIVAVAISSMSPARIAATLPATQACSNSFGDLAALTVYSERKDFVRVMEFWAAVASEQSRCADESGNNRQNNLRLKMLSAEHYSMAADFAIEAARVDLARDYAGKANALFTEILSSRPAEFARLYMTRTMVVANMTVNDDLLKRSSPTP